MQRTSKQELVKRNFIESIGQDEDLYVGPIWELFYCDCSNVLVSDMVLLTIHPLTQFFYIHLLSFSSIVHASWLKQSLVPLRSNPRAFCISLKPFQCQIVKLHALLFSLELQQAFSVNLQYINIYLFVYLYIHQVWGGILV